MKLYFSVPHDPILRKKWIEQIEKHQPFDRMPISYPVCERHFDATNLVRNGKRCTLIKGTVPTIFPEYVF